jgi:hypothetical protein
VQAGLLARSSYKQRAASVELAARGIITAEYEAGGDEND